MTGIDKSFGANKVLRGVNLALDSGEIHALLGENGAGKSTLMNILGGVLRADAGSITLDGQEKSFLTPGDSLSSGIAFIHQELNLINDLPIYENLFIGREIKKSHTPFLSKAKMRSEVQRVLSYMEVSVSPDTLVSELDASYKQTVEIARALLFNARIIIMDEPTTSLAEHEIEHVFSIMRTLKARGVSFIFISHKLKEVTRICDSYTVLRDGVNAGDGLVRDVPEADLARMMVGHDVNGERVQRSAIAGAEKLRCSGLSLTPYFKNISFTLHAGEILGFTGLLGDGRSELFQTVFGYLHGYTGEIYIDGKLTRIKNTTMASRLGIGYVPRDRKENGILKDLTILENGSLASYERLRRLLLINHRRERAEMNAQINALSISLQSTDDLITSLSGGNQQKVVLARWLNARSRVLVFDNPTQGVDVGAKEEIYSIIRRLADEGCALIILSSEAQEIVRVCDRAYVMYHGRINGELSGNALSEDNIMLHATDALTQDGGQTDEA